MYRGPPIDDVEIMGRLTGELRDLLKQVNGYVAYHGGLHLRGACREPAWHSLRAAWDGDQAIHRLFPGVRPDDVPFAQDALGDQYLLRGGIVHRLWAETGEMESTGRDLAAFDAGHRADPLEFLGLHPLHAFRQGGGELHPGMLMQMYPPFCANHDQPRCFSAVPSAEAIAYLSTLARQLAELPEGSTFRIVPE